MNLVFVRDELARARDGTWPADRRTVNQRGDILGMRGALR